MCLDFKMRYDSKAKHGIDQSPEKCTSGVRVESKGITWLRYQYMCLVLKIE